MKDTYRHVEIAFEKLTSNATAILGNSITFIIALCVVIYWFSNDLFYSQDIHQTIGDVILGITFLTLFIIQKAFNHCKLLLFGFWLCYVLQPFSV
jgi:low affinity Fe/Cu permease